MKRKSVTKSETFLRKIDTLYNITTSTIDQYKKCKVKGNSDFTEKHIIELNKTYKVLWNDFVSLKKEANDIYDVYTHLYRKGTNSQDRQWEDHWKLKLNQLTEHGDKLKLIFAKIDDLAEEDGCIRRYVRRS